MLVTIYILLLKVSSTVIYILRFRNEKNESDDYLTVNSLKDAMLGKMLENAPINEWIGHFLIQPYDHVKDELHVLGKDVCDTIEDRQKDEFTTILEKDEHPTENKKKNTNQRIKWQEETAAVPETQMKIPVENVQYMEVKIPVSQLLYIKIINLSHGKNEQLSDEEIHSVLHLLMSMDNVSEIKYALYMQFLGDHALIGRLRQLHAERANESMDIDVVKQGNIDCLTSDIEHVIRNVYSTMKRNYLLLIKDQYGNTALATRKAKGDRRLKMYIPLEDISAGIPGSFLRMDYNFLCHNKEALYSWIDTLGEEIPKMTIELDFCNFFRLRGCSYECTRVSTNVPILGTFAEFYRVITCNFVIHRKITKIILRLSNVCYDFDFCFLDGVKLELWCYECIFDEKSVLPEFLDLLSVKDSLLKASLSLPPCLNVLYMSNCRHQDDTVVLHVGTTCRHVSIEDHSGLVNFGDITRLCTFMLPLKSRFSVSIVKNLKGQLQNLKVKNVQVASNWTICDTIKRIYLENVTVLDNNSCGIHSKSRSVVVRHCSGLFDFDGFRGFEHVHLFGSKGTLEYVGSASGDVYRFTISNLWINKSRVFNSGWKKILFSDIKLSENAVITFEQNGEIQEIVCDRCYGRFIFSKIVSGVGSIFFTRENGYFEIKRRAPGNEIQLKITNVDINENIKLGDGIAEIVLENVNIEDGYAFETTSPVKKIVVDSCSGEFIIHGIATKTGNGIILRHSSSSIHLLRKDSDNYILYMANITFSDTIEIKFAVDTAVFVNVKVAASQGVVFEKGCERLTLNNCDRLVQKEEGVVFKKLSLCRLASSVAHYYFSAETEELQASEITLYEDVCIWRNVKAISLYRIFILNNKCFEIRGEPDLLSLQQCSKYFNLPCLTEKRDENVLFLSEEQSEIHLFRSRVLSGSIAVGMKGCEIHKDIVIRNDVKHLSLSNITGGSDVKLVISNSCERLIIESCEISVMLAKYSPLISMVMKRQFFIQDISKFVNLQALYIANVSLQQDLILNNHIKVFKMEKSRIEKGYALRLNKGVKNVVIVSFSGVVDTSSIMNMGDVWLNGTETFTFKRENNADDIYLGIRNMIVAKNLKIDPRVKRLELINTTIDENAQLKINSACESVRIVDCDGRIDFSEAISLTFIGIEGDMIGWVNSLTPIVKNRRRIVPGRLFPSHTEKIYVNCKSVKLVSQVIDQDVCLTFDEECESVSLINCAGTFDVSEVLKLKRLVYQPQGALSDIRVEFPDLSNVEELVLVYNGDDRYFPLLLLACRNVKRLTLYSYRAPNAGIRQDDMITDKWTAHAKELKYINNSDIERIVRESSHEDDHFFEKIFNRIMNILIRPIFTSTTENILESLSLYGFKPSVRSMKEMRNFVALETLILDYEYVDKTVLEHLPNNITTLSMLKGQKPLFTCPKLCCSAKRDKAIAFREHKFLKTFVVDADFFTNTKNFFNLPKTLECLKITYTNAFSKANVPVLKKLKLKRLVIIDSDELNNELFLTENYNTNVVRFKTFTCFLSNFIDIFSLDELSAEIGNTVVSLSPRDY
ncbi:putative LRR containing protein [Trachipleistophora hominis]|uniref:Putative LRR containing protein n=1 Tax=Trachipleistophora hominis TaxID=72359 RepID=L7JVK3_TRAHO|nr:putative LRR containing protein [Trachipleistophora hominis]